MISADTATAKAAVPIQRIAALWPMNLDCGARLWILRRFGEAKYPGISTAKEIEWWESPNPDGKTFEAYVAEGTFPLDCEGGPHDHHPHGKFPNECGFTLVLKDLHLDGDLRFDQFSKYVVWDDTRYTIRDFSIPTQEEGHFHLGRLFKDLLEVDDAELTGDVEVDSARYTAQTWEALDLLFRCLNNHLEKQTRFFTLGKQDYERETARRGRLIRIPFPQRDGTEGEWRIVAGESNRREFATYARSTHGCGAHIVVQKFPASGHVMVATSGARLNYDALVELFRDEEQRVRRPAGPWLTDPAALRAEGTVPEIPQWYYLRADPSRKGGSTTIFNGTRRHTSVEPTALSLEQLIMLVMSWFAEGKHHFPRAAKAAAPAAPPPATTVPPVAGKPAAATPAKPPESAAGEKPAGGRRPAKEQRFGRGSSRTRRFGLGAAPKSTN